MAHSTIEHDDTGGGFTVHTPLVVSTDVWPSYADTEDPATPVLGWVAETSINGFSLGFDYSDDKPTGEAIERVQAVVFRALRDAVRPHLPEATDE